MPKQGDCLIGAEGREQMHYTKAESGAAKRRAGMELWCGDYMAKCSKSIIATNPKGQIACTRKKYP